MTGNDQDHNKTGNLFAYGTLMCDDIMQEASGCRLSGIPAILRDYDRRAVKHECYPALIPKDGSRVEGLMYPKVPPLAWDRLDRFEGEMYTRTPVQIEISHGVTVGAETYVIKSEYIECLEQWDWNPAQFLQSGKEEFQAQYKGYESLQANPHETS